MPVVLFTPRTVAVYAPVGRVIKIADSRLLLGGIVVLMISWTFDAFTQLSFVAIV